MALTKLEYIWLDGYKPEPNLRSKTKVVDLPTNYKGDVKKLPIWAFDGSSTQQAKGHYSDCLLKPVTTYRDPERRNAWLVMCEVLNPDGSVHSSNTRAQVPDNKDFWFGWEQEYTLVVNGRPLGFPEAGYPAPQGMYYCSVGNGNVAGREIVEEHFDVCLDAGLNITGINAEVMLGQWEYQCLSKGAKVAGDDLWVSRYLLFRICEKYGVDVEFAPKPVQGDWNGSGCHTNFSNKKMRETGGEAYFKNILEAFRKRHLDHIAVYGSDNDMRLTGLHETQHISTFSYGASDRGASIRIPVTTAKTWKGYLEDRRPASNIDPYKVVARIIATVEEAEAMSTKKTKTKAKATTAKKKKATTKKKDDLTKVEGIGPKIQELLNKNGIKTYGELSAMSAKKIKTILESAGSRYRIHDPKTWPKQAKLAAAGNWDKLNAWQEELSGGK